MSAIFGIGSVITHLLTQLPERIARAMNAPPPPVETQWPTPQEAVRFKTREEYEAWKATRQQGS